VPPIRLDLNEARAALDAARACLAVSEKERERLKGLLDERETHHGVGDGVNWKARCEIAEAMLAMYHGQEAKRPIVMVDATEKIKRHLFEKSEAENAQLRRELENMKRSHESHVRDSASVLDQQQTQLLDQGQEISWLNRELDRERAKNKKRGL